ncbi:hypothetical protein [Actinopolymorpha pittospori]|uniref:hypothetical protein n=1 Tax=Actinopolymorpha pittospori TaxID=648752 RepID=UPI00178AF229|nr:hypothetical protein [Actinopolymorpha pittospori]
MEPGHALAACLFDITYDSPPNEADLSAKVQFNVYLVISSRRSSTARSTRISR